MNLDIDKLSKYDLTNAQVGDKVVIAYQYDYSKWYLKEAAIKSVSSKRGDITFNDQGRTRVDRTGRRIGASRWENKYYIYLEATQGNKTVINSYLRAMNKAGDIILLFDKIEKQGFKMLYDLPEDKISVLHKTLQEIFGAEND